MLRTEIKDNSDTIKLLLDKLIADVKGNAMVAAARDAGKIVANDAKTRVTPAGYPGDKPGLAPLSESIIVTVREYRDYTVAYVGGAWPQGAHMHLVEFGHLQKLKDGKVITIPPKPALRPAAESTQSAQQQAIENRLMKAAKQ